MPALETNLQEQIRSGYNSLKKNIPNFNDRFQQRKMIASVANAFAGETKPIIVIEGPTGTGKTLAYLLAAIPVAQFLEKRLIVSSSTVALQEQLLQKDIPIIEQYTDYKFKVKLAKGRGRFVCITRLTKLASGEMQENLFDDDKIYNWNEPPSKTDVKTIKKLFKNYKDNTWNGDRDSSEIIINNNLWNKINNNFHACNGGKCPEYYNCIFYQERKQLSTADIIIANHDLLLSDISGEHNVVLPPIEESLYILDEAHHLSNKAISHFTARSSILGAIGWLQAIPKTLQKKEIKGLKEKTADIIQACAQLASALENLHENLIDANLKPLLKNDTIIRFPFGKPPQVILEIGEKHIWPVVKTLRANFISVLIEAKEKIDPDDADFKIKEQQLAAMSFLSDRLNNLYQLWYYMLKTDDDKQSPFARWMEPEKDDFILNVSPLNASLQLSSRFWQKTEGCLLTSATLTALNSFDRLKNLLGLDDKLTEFVRLGSPFDLSKVNLNIPKMKNTPKQVDLHTAEIVALLPDLLDSSLGNLVLFSSYRQMEQVFQDLPNDYKAIIQTQGSNSKEYILRIHKETIEKNLPSTLFGVSSFAEGLDLPGKLCEHVIIAKLPFAVPNNPREQAYYEWVESLGENPFFSISVPDTSMRLTQACGRLIRKEEDFGNITILDTRLASTNYGRVILNSLPPYSKNNILQK